MYAQISQTTVEIESLDNQNLVLPSAFPILFLSLSPSYTAVVRQISVSYAQFRISMLAFYCLVISLFLSLAFGLF